MKAVEFIRKFGWGEAKKACHYMYMHQTRTFTLIDRGDKYPCELVCISYIDLKKYTDAYELVQSFNGVEMAKRFIDENIECNDSELLKQATTLVEEVGEWDE